MPGIEISAKTTAKGAIWSQLIGREAGARAELVEHKVAERGRQLVKERLHRVLQHPTGYYESQIATERTGVSWRVTDSDVIYGPWLEGIGSRNFPVTRFPGYFTFRSVTEQLQHEAPAIANVAFRGLGG